MTLMILQLAAPAAVELTDSDKLIALCHQIIDSRKRGRNGGLVDVVAEDDAAVVAVRHDLLANLLGIEQGPVLAVHTPVDQRCIDGISDFLVGGAIGRANQIIGLIATGTIQLFKGILDLLFDLAGGTAGQVRMAPGMAGDLVALFIGPLDQTASNMQALLPE